MFILYSVLEYFIVKYGIYVIIMFRFMYVIYYYNSFYLIIYFNKYMFV